MFKKMLSTILVAMLILSIFAVMPAMADEKVTLIYNGNFEDAELGTYNADFAGRIAVGASFVTREQNKVVVDEMIGPDGTTTKVGKVYADPNGTLGTAGSSRLYFSGAGWPTEYSGAYAYEVSIYTPGYYKDEISGERFVGSLNRFYLNTIRKQGGKIHSGEDTAYGEFNDAGWTKIKSVITASGEALIYVDGVLAEYKKTTSTTKPSYFQINARYGMGDISQEGGSGIHYVFDKSKYTDEEWAGLRLRFAEGQHIIIDDVKIYTVGEVAAEATATYPANNETGVTFATNPSVTYDLPIMNVVGDVLTKTDGSVTVPDAISTENVTLEDITDPENIQTLDVAGVTLSADGKTLEIEPAAEFEGNKTIRVTVSGLTDEYDNAVAATSFQFETMEQVELTGTPVFKKENLVFSNGSEITSLQNGYISCNYTLTNGESASAVDVLFFAVLKVDGVVEGFQFKSATVGANGGTATFNGGFNVTDAANSVIEVYVWDGFRNMASFVPMVSFDAE